MDYNTVFTIFLTRNIRGQVILNISMWSAIFLLMQNKWKLCTFMAAKFYGMKIIPYQFFTELQVLIYASQIFSIQNFPIILEKSKLQLPSQMFISIVPLPVILVSRKCCNMYKSYIIRGQLYLYGFYVLQHDIQQALYQPLTLNPKL